jgi:hypothetical protein
LHIGINGYAPTIGSLRYCSADAAAVRNALNARRDGFNSTRSTLLADGQEEPGDTQPPTRANIIAKVKETCEQATANDTLLIQFSGHGSLSADGHLYLLPFDVVPGAVEDTAISWQWLIEKVENSLAKKKILIIDACHSGAGRDAQQAKNMSAALMMEMKQRGDGFVCLSSCSGGELAFELSELGHGIFSYYLKEGIKGAADPLRRGVIDVVTLYTFTRDRTLQEAKRLGAKQNPHFISKVAASLDTFIITATPLDRTINRVLVLTEDPLLGHILKVAIARSTEVREAVWKVNIEEEYRLAEEGFDYTAVYIDVGTDWSQKKKFIVLIRQKYPVVPFVLVGLRKEFLGSLGITDRHRFEQYFFFDTNTPVWRIPNEIVETLAQVGWDITAHYGEQVQD